MCDHMARHLPLNPSWSSQVAGTFAEETATTFAASNVDWAKGWQKTSHAMSVKIGCLRLGKHKPRPMNRRNGARPRLRHRNPKNVRPWTILSKSMLLKKFFNFLPRVPAATGRNGQRLPLVLGRGQTEVEKSATRPSRSCEPKSMASSISVVGRPASDGSERHRLWSGDRKRRHGADRRQDSPRHHIRDMTADEERLSGPIQALRVGPAPGDKWMRLVVQGPTAFPRRRTPVLRPLPLMLTIIASLQAIADPCNHRHLGHRPTESLRPVIIMREDERVLKGPDHRTSPDVKYSCLQNVAKSPERRTITVISSPAQPVQVEEPAVEVAGPAAVAGPSEVMEGPAVDSPASDDPAGNDLASDGPADGPAVDGSVGDGSARCDDPSRKQASTDGSALQFDDPADSDSPARHQSVVLDGPAAHGTPAGTMPSGGQDASILTGVSSPLFPSIPTSINQAILIDFMSMWTLLQRWMDQGMAPDAQASPAAQSTVPVPRDDTTPMEVRHAI